MTDDAMDKPASPTGVRFVVLGWLCVLATLAYIHRTCLAVPAKAIQGDLKITDEQMSAVMTAFFLGYALFQIPSGWLGDRWGTRRALTLFIVLWTLATGWMSFAAGLAGLLAANLVKGIAQAGIFPCSVNTISKWFPETGRAMPSGMLGSFMSIGAVIASALMGLLMLYFTWQEAFIYISIPGVIVAAGFYWWFRNEPREHSWVNQTELALIEHGRKLATPNADRRSEFPLIPMLASTQLWLICGQQFFRAAGQSFYFTWFPTFLQVTRGVSMSESGFLNSLPLLGIVVGSGAGGVVMDWIYRKTQSKQRSRQGIAFASMLGCAACIVSSYFLQNPWIMVGVVAAGSFVAGLTGPAAYTATIDLGGRHVATVFSTMNMMGNLGAALMPFLVVYVKDFYGWNAAILLLAGLYVGAALCWSMINLEGSIFPESEQT